MFSKVFAIAALVMLLTLVLAGTALAANPSGSGQPSQTCLSSTTTSTEPGNAASAPGSAFNEVSGIAGPLYAGSQPQNSNNPKSVAQYDVACYQVTTH